MHRATTCAPFIPKGEIIVNFSPLRLFVKSGSRTLVARTCLGGAAESEQPSKKSSAASPSGTSRKLAPSSRSLAEHGVEMSPVAVQGTAPLAQCKSSYYVFLLLAVLKTSW